MIRERGVVSVKTPADLVPLRKKGASVQTFTPDGLLEIWDGTDWTPITTITATRRRHGDADHRLVSIEARGGVVEVTAHHRLLTAEHDPIRADAVEAGDELALYEEWSEFPCWTVLSDEMAELLGLLAADGYVERGGRQIQFVNNDISVRQRVAELWSKTFLGQTREWTGVSGFAPERGVERLNLSGVPGAALWLREQLYTKTAFKQVPPLVLNSTWDIQQAFLRGYYAGDGLKRGNGLSIKTNSPVLAQGVAWMYHLNEQPVSVYVERREGKAYYQLNIPTAVPVGGKGRHLRKNPAEVRRIVDATAGNDDWVFDLETESGVFAAGVGRLVVHNSPRRGLEFVTRKVTNGAAAIKLGLQDELRLGNLDAERDWGYAGDYVEAMWLMLQQDEPEDFVIATNKTHSVRELVEHAFGRVGLDAWESVRVDPEFLRPAEVDHLRGSYAKAKEKLGWEPRTSFEELVNIMVDADLERLRQLGPVARYES